MRCGAISPTASNGEIGIAAAAANRSAHREKNDVGSLHCFRKETRKPYTFGRYILRATSCSKPGSYMGITFLFS